MHPQDLLDVSEAITLQSILDHLDTALLLTTGRGNVIYMNAKAQKQIKSSNAVRLVGNRVQPTNPTAARAFAAALARVAATDPMATTPAAGVAIVLPDHMGTGVIANIVRVKPAVHTISERATHTAIFLYDPAAVPYFPGEAFAKLYGLTAAELRVLLELASGSPLQKIAADFGVALQTIKTHLKHIFQKTGVGRQSDLMRLVWRLSSITAVEENCRLVLA